ncbi:MAG: FAD-binding oxidoreductase [Lentisphaeraceae bacterium]|nr:FAD-binding oxidoreductase [Lentisphaeraceae bacterium]
MSIDTFTEKVAELLPKKNIITDRLRRLAYGTDASFYKLEPKLVLKPRHESDILIILQNAISENVSVTFRTAGTSLSGQGVSDSVLICLSQYWQGVKVSDKGKYIQLQPGVIGGVANRHLKAFGRKIGPDPASIESAMIGGIVANNASGMCCGTKNNSYQTIKSMRLVLIDGTVLDTANEESIAKFRSSHSQLLDSLLSIREEILSDEVLLELIGRKYSVKNTTGYGLNSFLDFENPLDILTHLIVGSEGTLAFISDVTFETVEDYTEKSCALVVFENMKSACDAVSDLRKLNVNAVELLDYASLKAAKSLPGMPSGFSEGAAALLVDVQSSSQDNLAEQISKITQSLRLYTDEVEFVVDDKKYAQLWKIRKGLFPIVGAVRPANTTVIIEDICFPLESLAAGTLDLQELFKAHDYHEAIIFGHALDGNLHFVFTQGFQTDAEVARYAKFMDAVCQLVAVDYKGSLKAEHGTGRNMAPFVELEWGRKAYEYMCRVKQLFDPQNILNPDVIITKKKDLHITHLKPMNAVHPLVDKCIECGFCESVCPSKNLTLSPRQRIATLRAQAAGTVFDSDKSLNYMVQETCAGDSMCSTKCPVDIDTGKMVKYLRGDMQNYLTKAVAQVASNNFLLTSKAAKVAMSFKGLPKPNKLSANVLSSSKTQEKVLYFSSCVHGLIGANNGQKPVKDVLLSLFKKLKIEPILLNSNTSHCCGLPFESKGFEEAAANSISKLKEELLKYSQEGYKVICDNSPCSQRLKGQLEPEFRVEDAVVYFASKLYSLSLTKRSEKSYAFSVCSLNKSGQSRDLYKIAHACLEDVCSSDISCCGFAGDRGFTHPELNESALESLKPLIQKEKIKSGYSSSRTCEIGLSKNSGVEFSSILALLDECSK